MYQTKTKIWIWYQHRNFIKAVFNESDNSLSIYNEEDEMILKKRNISSELLKKIEYFFTSKGVKRLDQSKEPFFYI
ncbi:MAG: hypothetical protein R6V50_04105 [Thermoplasmatota archaeon]